MGNESIVVMFLELAGRSFAVEASQVETLRRKETLFPAREGPADLLGFLPMGQRIPVLDLGVRLGVLAEAWRGGLVLVVAPEVAPLAFRVDRVAGPDALPWDELALLPELLQSLQPRPLVWGVARREDTLVPLLDLGQVVPGDEIAALLELANQDRL